MKRGGGLSKEQVDGSRGLHTTMNIAHTFVDLCSRPITSKIKDWFSCKAAVHNACRS